MISHMLTSNDFNPFRLITVLQNDLNLYVLHIGYQNSSSRTQISLRMDQSARNM